MQRKKVAVGDPSIVSFEVPHDASNEDDGLVSFYPSGQTAKYRHYSSLSLILSISGITVEIPVNHQLKTL
jgi:hypothetical protein